MGKSCLIQFTNSCCLFTQDPSYQGKVERGTKCFPNPQGCHSGDDEGCGGCPGGGVTFSAELRKNHGRFGLSQRSARGPGEAHICVWGRWASAGVLRGWAAEEVSRGAADPCYPAEVGGVFKNCILLCFSFYFSPPKKKKKTTQALELIKQRTEMLGCAGVQL